VSYADTQAAIDARNLAQAKLDAFISQNMIPLSPWDTPQRILEWMEATEEGGRYRANQLAQRGFEELQSELQKLDRKIYLTARARVLEFINLAPSVRDDFWQATDPAIGVQNLRAWCEDAMTPMRSDITPLGPLAAVVYEHLLSLPQHRAMTGREIVDWLSKEQNKYVDDKQLHRDIINPLKEGYGLRNKPKIGYYIPRTGEQKK
jgi:hypothetical protein